MVIICLRLGRVTQEAVKDNMCTILEMTPPVCNCIQPSRIGEVCENTTFWKKNANFRYNGTRVNRKSFYSSQAEWDFLKAAGQLQAVARVPSELLVLQLLQCNMPLAQLRYDCPNDLEQCAAWLHTKALFPTGILVTLTSLPHASPAEQARRHILLPRCRNGASSARVQDCKFWASLLSYVLIVSIRSYGKPIQATSLHTKGTTL